MRKFVVSRSKYVTISVTGKIFNNLEAACKEYIDTEEAVVNDVSRAMLGKFRQYSALVITPAAKFFVVVDLCFRNDILSDAEKMRDLVGLPDPTDFVEGVKSVMQTRSFTDAIPNENSGDVMEDDEAIRFLRATNNREKDL